MAFTDVVPATGTINMVQAAAQKFLMPTINSSGGSAVDLSAWVSLVCKMVPPTPVPYGADTTFGTVTAGAAGLLYVETGASDLASVPPGSAKFIITGKPTSGDAAQLLASGSLGINAG